MPIEFTSLSMMALRKRPGEILDRVAKDGEAFLIERAGTQKACLVPLSVFLPDIQPQRVTDEINALSGAEEQFQTSVSKNNELVFSFPHEGQKHKVVLSIVLPHGYPNASPRVLAEPIKDKAPHRWQDGSLCLFGVTDIWNPGKHDVLSTIQLARRWLQKYETWEAENYWPDRGEAHEAG